MSAVMKADKLRYREERGRVPRFQMLYRRTRAAKCKPIRLFYQILFHFSKKKRMIELSAATEIGEGLYFGHPYCITVNRNAKIGRNCNIHKGVTIGQENRGKRKGTPTIGDQVWIGTGAVIVGKITIGSDVLIAPNAYVNCDVPDHSVVVGNPCVIHPKENATEGYICFQTN